MKFEIELSFDEVRTCLFEWLKSKDMIPEAVVDDQYADLQITIHTNGHATLTALIEDGGN